MVVNDEIGLTGSMDISLDENVDTSDSIKWDLNVFVVPPVTHARHVCSLSLVLFVTWVPTLLDTVVKGVSLIG